MIKVNDIAIKPTMFPDGTSQVWKLPPGLFAFAYVKITWYFEHEREIMDICSIKALIPEKRHVTLYMPYLPYARQDKEVSNGSTFNLKVFADIINSLKFDAVLAVDVHNPELTKSYIKNFQNLGVTTIQENLAGVVKPNYIVFPDEGASKRYSAALSRFAPVMFFKKNRDPITGQISYVTPKSDVVGTVVEDKQSYLIIDDICDGGATFIAIARLLYSMYQASSVSLFVTHGLFSKGKKVLEDEGITVYTTNSLLKNVEGINV